MAAISDLLLEQGVSLDSSTSYWIWSIDGTPVDLTGYSASLEIYRSPSSTTALATFSTANGKLVLTPLAGKIAPALTSSDTSALYSTDLIRAEDIANAYVVGSYVLDLTSPAASVKRLLQGRVLITPKILQIHP